MVNIFEEDGMIFENALNLNDISFMQEMTKFMEEYDQTHYVTESMITNIANKIKGYFASLLESFRNFKAEVRVKLNSVIKEKQIKKRLRKMIDELKENKKKGAEKATTIDIIKYQKVYLQAYGELNSYAKRIKKATYSRMEDLDFDLEKFNNIYAKYMDELKEIGNQKVDLPIDQVLKFCQDELYGNSKVLKTVNDTETKIYLMKVEAENLEHRKNILGDKLIVRRFGVIRSMFSTIGKIVKTAITKFLMWIVFIFA